MSKNCSGPTPQRTPSLVDDLLNEIYARFPRRRSTTATESADSNASTWNNDEDEESEDGGCTTEYSTTSSSGPQQQRRRKEQLRQRQLRQREQQRQRLSRRAPSELRHEVRRLETQIAYSMSQLTRQVKRRDRLRRQKERQYNLVTAILQASSQKRSEWVIESLCSRSNFALSSERVNEWTRQIESLKVKALFLCKVSRGKPFCFLLLLESFLQWVTLLGQSKWRHALHMVNVAHQLPF